MKYNVPEARIDQFIGKVELGKDFFMEAGVLLVKLIDEEPAICERITTLGRGSWLTMDVLKTFEAIGRKQLSVEAMFLPRHVLNRLIALPVSEQSRIVNEPITVLSDGRHSIDKPVSKLTKREAKVAIGPKGVRSIQEQREFNAKFPKCGLTTIRLAEFQMHDLAVRISKRVYSVWNDEVCEGEMKYDPNGALETQLVNAVEDELTKTTMVVPSN